MRQAWEKKMYLPQNPIDFQTLHKDNNAVVQRELFQGLLYDFLPKHYTYQIYRTKSEFSHLQDVKQVYLFLFFHIYSA